ncbi:hypothetical protein [Streptomyces sp. NPDC053048]|uniref:hypothetical protein n=1 Tax=Streptomyces sp. NPDC053048 TaxID=3365694 RepID=UPI0037D45436
MGAPRTGVRRPEDSTCVLSYTVETDPAPIQVSHGPTPARAALRITVTNHRHESVQLEEIRFSFPVGDGPDDLTAVPDSGEPELDDTRHWRFEYDADSRTFVLTPRRSQHPLDFGDQLDLAIANVQVNSAVGTSTLTITETLQDGGEPGTEEWPLAKVPAGFTVGDFRPDYILVQSGTAARLSWRGESMPGATYTMLHDGDPVDVTAVRSWPTPPLHRDTAFALVVRVEAGESVAEYAMSTTVTVARPDLAVGELTVHGRATLTHLPTEFDLGEAGERSFTAETDGFLTGHLVTEQDVAGDGAPTLSVTVSAGGTDRRTSVQARQAPADPGDPTFPGSRLTAVVPRGARVTIGRSGTAPSRHRLSWLPFGTGELKAAE